MVLSHQSQMETKIGKLENLYNRAVSRPCGHSLKYRGYTLEKVDWTHPEHSEYSIKNREGKVVESYTITAFDSPEDLKQNLDKLINRNPSNVKEAIRDV